MEPLVLGHSKATPPGTSPKIRRIPPHLPLSIVSSLANVVRAMNCYYSNLIEGHDTHPIDIERALKSDYSRDTRKRDLQYEAKAHVTVQEVARPATPPWSIHSCTVTCALASY